MNLARKLSAEFLGTAMFLAAVVGSGIMGERLSGGNVAIALLANSIATGAVLISLIITFGKISGAHFNPVVTIASAMQRHIPWKVVPGFITAQVAGAFLGVAAAHLMFNVPLFSQSEHIRDGWSQIFSEFIATFGLISIIFGSSKQSPSQAPFAVGLYIVGAYWFTSSTSFANPAVTLARAFTNTFSGIRLVDTPSFILAQMFGAISATIFFKWLLPRQASLSNISE